MNQIISAKCSKKSVGFRQKSIEKRLLGNKNEYSVRLIGKERRK